jgi:hypothetical protein
MILLLLQDGMEVDDGLIVAATAVMDGSTTVGSNPRAKSTLVRFLSHVSGLV